MNDQHPPRWAQDLLSLFVSTRRRESVVGDLLEDYRETQVGARGKAGADAWYVRQVLGFAARAFVPWGLALAATLIVRDILDLTFPVNDYRLRATVSTYLGIALLAAAGVRAGWSAQRAASGAIAGTVAAIVACTASILFAAAAMAIAGPRAGAGTASFAALVEALDVPVIPILFLGIAAGTAGGALGLGVSRLTTRPRASTRR